MFTLQAEPERARSDVIEEARSSRVASEIKGCVHVYVMAPTLAKGLNFGARRMNGTPPRAGRLKNTSHPFCSLMYSYNYATFPDPIGRDAPGFHLSLRRVRAQGSTCSHPREILTSIRRVFIRGDRSSAFCAVYSGSNFGSCAFSRLISLFFPSQSEKSKGRKN